MKIYIQRNSAAELIGGGESKTLLERMAALESGLAGLKTELQGKLNMDRVTQSTSVTEAGYVVDARELNASIGGTLASRVDAMGSEMAVRPRLASYGAGANFIETEVPVPENSGGTFLIIVWSRHQNAADAYILSFHRWPLLTALVKNNDATKVSYNAETQRLEIERGIGDDWGYVVEKLSPYMFNSYKDA